MTIEAGEILWQKIKADENANENDKQRGIHNMIVQYVE